MFHSNSVHRTFCCANTLYMHNGILIAQLTMERITIFIRTTKTSGKIKLRFRLTEGREVQLYHKSQIEADLADLKKFEIDGSLKPRVSIYNEELCVAIQQEIIVMREAYQALKKESNADVTADEFEKRIDMILNPERYNLKTGNEVETLLERFNRHMATLEKHGSVSKGSLLNYRVVRDKLYRYLTIFKKSRYRVEDFGPDDVLEFYDFIINEHTYVAKYPSIYGGLTTRSIPKKQAHSNTASSKLQILKIFFNELEESDEIQKSPFRRLSRARRHDVLSEQYEEPYYLLRDEVLKIMGTDVHDDLKETKDAFLLQCALGCRIGDFKEMDMSNVSVTDDGIPYVHYIAKKTVGTYSGRKEKTTPLMLFALDIVKRTGFKFNVLNAMTRKKYYNDKIKDLLKHCGIDRCISRFNEVTKKVDRIPLYEIGSSKLCRKTHVDIATKVQVNMYATGLHEAGSSAVEHYSKLGIKDLFVLMCLAFDQPQYRVDKNLNVIQEVESTEFEYKM